MLRTPGATDDWQGLAEALKRRIDELGMANLSALVRASKMVDGAPNKEGVSATTWRRLLNGEPLRRADKLQLACRTLGWSNDSAERILAGGGPFVEDLPELDIADRLNEHEMRLARAEAELRYINSMLDRISEIRPVRPA